MSCSEDQNERCVTPLLDEKQCITDSTNGITNISSPDINLDDNLDKADSINEEKSHSSENKAEQELISSSNNAINKSGSSGFDPIEGISDISDEEDENLRSAEILDDDKEKCNRDTEGRVKSNSNGQQPFKSNKPSNFKKITKNTRERNYRDRMKKENFAPQNPDARGFRRMDDRQPFNRYDKRREILRYNVRNVVARKNIPPGDMNSRSRSRSFTPKRIRRSNSRSMSPGFRDVYRRRSRSPSYHRASPRPSRKAIPKASHSHSPSLSLSPPPPSQKYRSRSVSPAAYIKYVRPPRSQSRSRSRERMEKHYRRRSRSVRKKKKESKKRKRSPVRSRTPSRSGRLSPQSQISSRSLSLESERQIINNIEQPWSTKPSIGGKPTENIKVILKNADAITKKKSKKKRERKRDGKKKIKDPKLKSKSDKFALETPKVASKEVFASGDNILVSVSFNNKATKEDDNLLSEGSSHKSKSKKQKVAVSPNSTLSFSGESDDEYDSKRRRKKKRKNKKERAPSESKPSETSVSTVATSKRKSDMKPIAIIDLDKSPIKEIGSPKDVIILTDSDPENKMHQKLHQNKDLNVAVQEQSIQQKPNSPVGGTTPPASPPHTQPSAPSVQFSFQLKSKPQILPFNPAFTQEPDDDEEEAIKQQETKNNPPEPAEIPSLVNVEDKTKKSPDVYDPFEPTKSGSNSPVSTPPRTNDVTSSSDMMKESSSEIQKLTQENLQQKNIEDSLISSSIWTKKDFDKKPCTPPLPASPSPVLQASTQPQKSSNLTLYSPQALQQSNSDKIPGLSDGMDSATQDMSMDLKSPYSPSSDDFNDMFEPPEPSPPPPNSTPSTFIDTSSVINLTGKGGISSFETVKLNVDYESSKCSGVAGKSNYGNSSSFSFNKNNSNNEPKKALTLTASTLKTFNSQRSNVSQTNMFNKMGINYVNKNEMNIVENFLKSPAGLPMGSSGTITTTQTNSQQKAGRPATNFTRTKTSRFSKPPNDSNGSPVRAIRDSSYHHDSFRDIDDVPNSAVDLMVHDKWVKKINRQERVVEEVKLVLKPIYNKKQITKDEYKDILRRAVPKICHNRTGEINVQKIRSLIHAYVKKVRYKRKIDSGKMHTTN